MLFLPIKQRPLFDWLMWLWIRRAVPIKFLACWKLYDLKISAIANSFHAVICDRFYSAFFVIF